MTYDLCVSRGRILGGCIGLRPCHLQTCTGCLLRVSPDLGVFPPLQLLMGSELCVLVIACVISPLLEPCLGVSGCSYSLPSAAGGSIAAGELQRALKKASLPYQP